MTRLVRRIAYLVTARRRDAELREELEFHRARLEADRADGEGRRRTLGNVTLAREDSRGVWIWPWLQSVGQDATYAARMVRCHPAFGIAVILVLSLGIGATTAVFTLIDGLVLRSLPVHEAHRLVYFDQPSFSYPIFTEVRARGTTVFSGLFAWNLEALPVEWGNELESTEVLTASGDFYATLDVQPALGRVFTVDDDRSGGGPSGLVAVLSHAAWQRRFGGDPSVIGRTLRIEQKPFTIIGVAPPGFFGVAPGLAPELSIPLTSLRDSGALESRTSSWLHLMGRMRQPLTLQQANSAVQAFWPAVLEATTNHGMPADRRAVYLSRSTALSDGRAGFSRVRRQFEEPLWVLLALVTLLLTVACASVANLLLARGAARRREIAIRLAIGASRWRIIRQLLTEAVAWTSAGTVAGLIIAAWSSATLVRMMTTREEPIVLDVSFNWRILGFAVGLSLITAAICAIVPALRATRTDPRPALKEGREIGSANLRRWSLGKALVAAQVALTILLLVGGALFVRSLARILSQDAGIDRERVLVVSTDPIAAGYREAGVVRFYDAVLERMRAIPGVQSASLSWYPPISDDMGHWTQAIGIDGAPVSTDLTRTVYFNAVSPTYFDTVGMRMIHGRDFTPADDRGALRVAIVNESLARQFFPGQDPVGRRITIGRNSTRRDLEILGVVTDAKYQRLQETPRSIAYLPCAQLAEVMAGKNLFAEIRSTGPIAPVVGDVRRELQSLDARVPLHVETVRDRIDTSLVRERVLAMLAVVLGLVALTLACSGLYGLLSYAISRQTSEIGLRLALGASRSQVLGTVLWQGLTLASVGTLAGTGAAMAFGRFAHSLLFQVSPTDPAALTAAAAVMLAVAACAVFVPAWRAASVDPVVALRHE